MFCKWCGLESDTSDKCSWCGRSFATRPTTQAPPKPTPLGTPSPQPPAAPFADIDDDLSPIPFAPSPAAPPQAPAQPPQQPREDTRRPVAPLLSDAAFVDEPPPAAAPATFLDEIAPPRPAAPAPLVTAPDDQPPPKPAVPPILLTTEENKEPPAVAPRPAPPTPAATTRPAAPSAPSGYTPPPLRQGGATPPMEAIPIKRPPGGAPPPIPLARPPASKPPVQSAPPTFTPPPVPPKQAPPAVIVPEEASSVSPPPIARVPPQAQAPTSPAPQPIVRSEPEPAPLHIELPPLAPDVEEEPDPEIIVAPVPRIDIRAGAAPAPAAPRPAAPQPAASTATAAPRVSRTVYCRFCGMESETSDRCSWCRKDLRAAPPVATGAHPHITMARQVHARKPARPAARQPVAKPQPAPAPAPVEAPEPAPARKVAAPALGTFQAQQSKYYSGMVVDPVSGAHYDTDTGDAVAPVYDIELEELEEKTQQWRQVGIYAVSTLVLAGVLALATHMVPGWSLAWLAIGCVLCGLGLPLMRVVNFHADDADDAATIAALYLILGPYVGSLAYAVIATLRGNGNPAHGGNPVFIAMGLSYLVIRVPIDVAAGIPLAKVFSSPFVVTPPIQGGWAAHVVAHMLIFAMFAAWISADSFKKPDE